MGKRCAVAKKQEAACLEGIGGGPDAVCIRGYQRQKRSWVDKAQGSLSLPPLIGAEEGCSPSLRKHVECVSLLPDAGIVCELSGRRQGWEPGQETQG